MNNKNITRKLRLLRFISHFLILGIVLLLPEMFMGLGMRHFHSVFVYSRPLFFIGVFYLNYYVLIDKLFFSKKSKWLYFVVNALILLLTVIAIYVVNTLNPPLNEELEHHIPPSNQTWVSFHVLKMMSFMARDGGVLFLTVALSVALKLGEKWESWSALQKEMIAERNESELRNLKNQLNPHFLFNTLNNIYSLISISGEKAQKAVHQLSQLLRYVLYDNGTQKVTLAKEIGFVENYIELMRLRVSRNVDLNVKLPDCSQCDSMEIAPLLFMTLIENAFKHGVANVSDSFIDIEISIIETVVVCRVSNSYFPKDRADKSGSGIGIENLKRRLSILYPGRYSFSYGTHGKSYDSVLTIDLNDNENE